MNPYRELLPDDGDPYDWRTFYARQGAIRDAAEALQRRAEWDALEHETRMRCQPYHSAGDLCPLCGHSWAARSECCLRCHMTRSAIEKFGGVFWDRCMKMIGNRCA